MATTFVTGALAVPGKCVSCGSGDKSRRYADFGLDLEFYGTVYLCELCLNAAFAELKYSGVQNLVAEINALRTQIEEMANEREYFLGVIRAIRTPEPSSPNQPSLPFKETAVISIGAESDYTLVNESGGKS